MIWGFFLSDLALEARSEGGLQDEFMVLSVRAIIIREVLDGERGHIK